MPFYLSTLKKSAPFNTNVLALTTYSLFTTKLDHTFS